MSRAAARSPRFLLGVGVTFLAACGDAESVDHKTGAAGVEVTPATARADRRAYDGAPPVIPHDPIGACVNCHDSDGLAIPDLGYAPPCPHDWTDGPSAISNCNQCHVYKITEEVFRASRFVGRPQDLRKGARAYALAPPVMPHSVFMRESCSACHTGPAAREEIRCSHPERTNCRQCHVPATTDRKFERGLR